MLHEQYFLFDINHSDTLTRALIQSKQPCQVEMTRMYGSPLSLGVHANHSEGRHQACTVAIATNVTR